MKRGGKQSYEEMRRGGERGIRTVGKEEVRDKKGDKKGE